MNTYHAHAGEWLAGRLNEQFPSIEIFVEEVWKGTGEEGGYRGRVALRRWWSFTVSKRSYLLGDFEVSDRDLRTMKPSQLIGHYAELIGEWLAKRAEKAKR